MDLEQAKNMAEQLTGIGRPHDSELSSLVRPRKLHSLRFRDDGATPNNPYLPLLIYRSPVVLRQGLDPAAILEDVFAANGWEDSWRDSVYEHLHFHTRTHEVLGIARGWVRIQFGGAKGKVIKLKAGDVVVLPAGTGHRRVADNGDLLVVGAYPKSGGDYDEPKPEDVDALQARADIAKVPLPATDPVYGADGPMFKEWRARA
jgi:uncharacterized protein YjlB